MSGSNFNDTTKLATNYGNTVASAQVTTGLASDFVVSQAFIDQPGGDMAQVSTVQLTFTANNNEYVDLSYNGTISLGAAADCMFGYIIDASTPVIMMYMSGIVGYNNANWCTRIGPLSSGSHTIKLAASKSAGTTTVRKDNANPSVSQARRFVG